MKRATIVVAIVSAICGSALAQFPKDLDRKLDGAEQRIVRLPPTAFPELPANVVRELRRRGCTIPQLSGAYPKERRNVIKGEFAKPRQTDWAVLCSDRGFSSILVFWNGSEKNPAAIAREPDRNFLQGAGGDEIVYSREIRPVGKDFIMRHQGYGGGPTPPPINHQGIDDNFNGKASITWYFAGREWLRRTGAD